MVRPRSLIALRLACIVALGVSMALLLDSMRPQPAFCVSGSGCDQIRKLGLGRVAGVPVPAIGLGAYGSLLLLSFVPSLRQLTAIASMIGGLLGLGLIGFQALVLGILCKFCVVVDLSAMLAGGAGYALLKDESAGHDHGLLAWVGLLLAALGLPPALAHLAPPVPVPRTVQALQKPDMVNVIEFSDFECPFCRLTHPALDAALHHATDLKINFIRKTMPLPSHLHARDASRAYLCAESLGKGSEMADKLFAGSLSELGIRLAYGELNLPEEDFKKCLEDPATEAKIEASIGFVRSSNFQGLPTVWVNDQLLLGAKTEDEYLAAFRKAAAGSKNEGGSPLPVALVAALSLGLIGLGVRSGLRASRLPPAPAPEAAP